VLTGVILTCVTLLWFSAAPASANDSPHAWKEPSSPHFLPVQDKPGKGKFLIAETSLLDPNFSETVVLLIDYDESGAFGLVINRQTDVELTEVFPDMKGLKDREDRIFIGGPVEVRRVFLLVQAEEKPGEAELVFGDVYMSHNVSTLSRMVEQGKKEIRVYAGYSGWAPKQLDAEIARGDWLIVEADVYSIFNKTPSEVWKNLMRGQKIKTVRAKQSYGSGAS
jgi:putative transcriptional regulator